MSRPFLETLLHKIDHAPDAVFCWHYTDSHTATAIYYRDLPRLVGWRARALTEALNPGDLFFIIQDDAWEQIAWWLAALLAGVVPGILTPPTPKLDRGKYLADLRAVLETYGNARVAFGEQIVEQGLIDAGMAAYPFYAAPDARDHALTAVHRPPEMPLVFQQSSGTTGLRKGILLGEDAVVSQLDSYAQAIQLSASDVIVSWLPLYHDMGLVACLMNAVYHGLPLAITSPFTWLTDPAWLFRAAHQHRGTLCWLPNFAFNLLADRVTEADLEGISLDSLRLMVNCSEPVLPRSLDYFRTTFSPLGLNPTAVSSSYAMAENTFGVTQSRPGAGIVIETLDAHQLEHEARAVIVPEGKQVASSGSPIPGVEVRIIHDGRVCPDGVIGEIHIRGGSLMMGYYGVGEGLSPIDADGWYATGDTGYRRDGELFVLNRKKDLIIRGGRNLNPIDIEDVVSRVEDVKPGRVAAFGLLNEAEGTEDVIVLAEFGGARVSDIDRLKHRIHSALTTELDLAPQKVEILRPNWLVKSSSGKISRTGCKVKYEDMLQSRQTPRLFLTDYLDSLPEGDQDSFGAFGSYSKIRTPFEVSSPGRIHVGNWVVLGRYGKIFMITDFSRYEAYARQHFPDTDHTFDSHIYGARDPILKIGDGTNIGDYFFIACALSVEIGQFVLMSDRVFITDSTHLTDNLHLPIAFQSNTLGKSVRIGDHSWIGINVCIMEGVTIGKHAVISANSVVTSDVPDYAVVAGNPARVVKILDGGEPSPAVPAKGSQGDDLTAFLLRYFREQFGFPVSPDDSLFKSGLVDSLGSLDLIMSLEQYTGRSIDEAAFFARRADTIADIVGALDGLMGGL